MSCSFDKFKAMQEQVYLQYIAITSMSNWYDNHLNSYGYGASKSQKRGPQDYNNLNQSKQKKFEVTLKPTDICTDILDEMIKFNQKETEKQIKKLEKLYPLLNEKFLKVSKEYYDTKRKLANNIDRKDSLVTKIDSLNSVLNKLITLQLYHPDDVKLTDSVKELNVNALRIVAMLTNQSKIWNMLIRERGNVKLENYQNFVMSQSMSALKKIRPILIEDRQREKERSRKQKQVTEKPFQQHEKSTSKHNQTQELKKQIEKLNRKIHGLEKEKCDLRGQFMAKLDDKNQKKKMQVITSSFKPTNSRKVQTKINSKQEQQQNTSLLKEIEVLKKQNNELKDQTAHKIHSKQQQIYQLQRRIYVLQNAEQLRNKQLQKEIQNLKMQHKKAIKLIKEDKDIQYDNLNNQKEQLQKKNNQLCHHYDQSTKRINQFKITVQKQYNELQITVQKQSQNLKEAQSLNKTLLENIENLNKKNQEKDERIKSLGQEYAYLKSEKDRLDQQLTGNAHYITLSKQYEEKIRMLETLSSQLKSENTQLLSRARILLDQKEVQFKNLKEKMQAIKAQRDNIKKLEEKGKQINRSNINRIIELQNEVNKQKELIAEVTIERDQIRQQLDKTIAQSKEEGKKLQSQLVRITELQKQKQNLQSQVTSLTTKLQQQSAFSHNASEAKITAQKQVQSLRAEVDLLKSENENLLKKNVVMQQELVKYGQLLVQKQQLQVQVKDLRRDYEKLREEKIRAQLKIQQTNNTLQKITSDLNHHQTQAAAERKRLEDIIHQNQQHKQTADKTIKDQTAKLENLKEDYNKQKTQLDNEKNRNTHLQQILQNNEIKRKDLQSKCNVLEKQLSDLKVKNPTAQCSIKHKQYSQNDYPSIIQLDENENQSNKVDSPEYTQQIQKLKKQIQECKKYVQQSQQREQQLESKIKTLEEQLQVKKRVIAQNENTTKQKIEGLQKQIKELKDCKNQNQQELEQIKRKYDDSFEQIKKNEAQLREKVKNNTHTQTQNEQFQTKEANYKAQVNQQKQIIQNLTDQCAQAKKQLSQNQEQINGLKNQLQQLQENKKNSEEKYNALSPANTQLEEQKNLLQKQLEDRQTQLNSIQNDQEAQPKKQDQNAGIYKKDETIEQLQRITKQNKEVIQSNEFLCSQKKKLEEEVSRLKDQKQNYEKTKEDITKKLDESKDHVSHIVKENKENKEELEQIKKQHQIRIQQQIQKSKEIKPKNEELQKKLSKFNENEQIYTRKIKQIKQDNNNLLKNTIDLEQQKKKLMTKLKEYETQIYDLNHAVELLSKTLEQTTNMNQSMQMKAKEDPDKIESKDSIELDERRIKEVMEYEIKIDSLSSQLTQLAEKLKQRDEELEKSNSQLNLLRIVNEQLSLLKIELETQKKKQQQQEAIIVIQNENIRILEEQRSKLNQQRSQQMRALYNELQQKEGRISLLKRQLGQRTNNQDYTINSLFQHDLLVYQNQHKIFLKKVIEDRYNAKIIRSRLIYRFDLQNRTNFHAYIDGKEKVLLIVKLKNGNFLAAFTQDPFMNNRQSQRDAIIISLTNREVFTLNEPGRKGITYDSYYIIFGNSEIRLKSHENKIFSNFGINNGYYSTRGFKVSVLLGGGIAERELELENYEFYQLDLIYDL